MCEQHKARHATRPTDWYFTLHDLGAPLPFFAYLKKGGISFGTKPFQTDLYIYMNDTMEDAISPTTVPTLNHLPPSLNGCPVTSRLKRAFSLGTYSTNTDNAGSYTCGNKPSGNNKHRSTSASFPHFVPKPDLRRGQHGQVHGGSHLTRSRPRICSTLNSCLAIHSAAFRSDMISVSSLHLGSTYAMRVALTSSLRLIRVGPCNNLARCASA